MRARRQRRAHEQVDSGTDAAEGWGPMSAHLSQQELESYLWGAAVQLRGLVDAGDYKQFVFPLLFFKRISDVWDEEHARAVAEGGDAAYARATADDRFVIPDGAHWNDVRTAAKDVGPKLQKAFRAIEVANPGKLDGIFGDAAWTNKERLPDATLKNLLEHLSGQALSLANGDAAEAGRVRRLGVRDSAPRPSSRAVTAASHQILIPPRSSRWSSRRRRPRARPPAINQSARDAVIQPTPAHLGPSSHLNASQKFFRSTRRDALLSPGFYGCASVPRLFTRIPDVRMRRSRCLPNSFLCAGRTQTFRWPGFLATVCTLTSFPYNSDGHVRKSQAGPSNHWGWARRPHCRSSLCTHRRRLRAHRQAAVLGP